MGIATNSSLKPKNQYKNKMKQEEKIRGAYYGWFFGLGATLRKGIDCNYLTINNNPDFAQVDNFEQLPTTYELFDQLTQTQIVHEIIVSEGKITPELFKDKLLELNEKEDILNNYEYGPSTKKAVRKLLDGEDPQETGKKGVTTGGAMRCLPIGVYFYQDQQKLIENTYQSCIVSHNTDVAVSSALAVNLMLSHLLQDKKPGDALIETLDKLEETYGDYGEPTAFAHMYTRIRDAVSWVKDKDFEQATETIAKKIGFSWYAIEGIPAAFALYFASDTPQEAALMAFKAGYNQTSPQIACAFYGAERGPSIFPQKTMDKIEAENDFDIDHLVEQITD